MDLIESYREELCLVRKPWTAAGLGSIVVALLVIPWLKMDFLVYMATVVFIYSIGVQGQNILIGYTGQISFGQAGFLAIGAYTFGHASALGIPLPLGLLAAGSLAAIFGVIVGFPSLRLKGPYLAIATMGFGIAIYQILLNSEVISGGRMGLVVKKLPALFGLTQQVTFYYFTLLLALIFTLISFNTISSYAGRAFIAIRDNDIAAEAMGVNLARYKLLSFAMSSFYMGMQGALYSLLIGFLEPNLFTFMESVTVFVAVIIGGLASIGGSIMGAAFVILAPQMLGGMKELVPVIFGITILIILIFEPQGIAGRWLKIRLYFRNWPFR
jgi:branched-chain amino acid transport system permease protein